MNLIIYVYHVSYLGYLSYSYLPLWSLFDSSSIHSSILIQMYTHMLRMYTRYPISEVGSGKPEKIQKLLNYKKLRLSLTLEDIWETCF